MCADSRMPVGGVNARLTEIQYYQSTGVAMTTNIQVITIEKTDTNGVFYINAPKQIGIYIMPMDIFPLEYRLDLIYDQKVFETHEYLHRSLSDKHFYELGDIMFKPPTAGDITTRAAREK